MSNETADEENIVVTTIAPEGHEPPVAGSNRRECENCGDPVWVSPATQSAIDTGEYPDRLWCVSCAFNDSKAEAVNDE